MFVRLTVEVGVFRKRAHAIEVNFNVVEFFQRRGSRTRIVFAQYTSPGEYGTIKDVSTKVLESYDYLVQELNRTDSSIAEQFLNTGDVCVNLARVAMIHATEYGSTLTFASNKNVATRLTVDQIRRQAPRSFLPLASESRRRAG